MSTQIYTGVLDVRNCPDCGIVYGLDQDFDRRNYEEGRSWYCPAGHLVHYITPRLKELETQLADERSRRKSEQARRIAAQDQAAAAERSARAVRGHLTRLRRRIANGVCPWCKRSFKNVHDHVAGQHPERLDQLKAASA